MPLRLYAAIVTGNVAYSSCDHLDGLDNARARVELLGKLVAKASAGIETHIKGDSTKSPIQQVFLAPEYFFSKQRFLNNRFFDHDLKRWIVSQLSGMSKQYPNMLIVPGTVLWAKDAVRKSDSSMDLAKRYTIEMKNVERLQKLRDQTKTAFDKGYVAQGETSMQTASASGVTKFDKTTNTLTYNMDQAEQAQLKIVQNTAYVLLGGKVLKYHKNGNFAEVESETRPMVFQPGSVDGRFTVGNVRYGLEICLDHNIGMLTDSVDIQLIVSSYVDFAPSNARGPLVLHSSTERAGVYPDGKGGTRTISTEPAKFTKEVKAYDAFNVGSELTIFAFDLQKVAASTSLDLEGESIGEVEHIH